MHVFILATQRFLSCLICQGLVFEGREIKMATPGMAMLDLEVFNKNANGAVCVRCGFVHTFMGTGHQWVAPSQVRPGDLPDDPYDGVGPDPEAR